MRTNLQEGVKNHGICQCTERFDKGKKQGGVQSDQKTADLYRDRGSNGNSKLFSSEKCARYQQRSDSHGAFDAAGVFICHV